MTRAIRTPLDEAVELDLTSAESLDAIVAATANARVVLLGEATHGDGATFAAKAAIARHLHEHAGFDVLAWEAGSYDCWRTDRAFAAGADPIEALELGLHQIWVAEEVRPLAEYIRHSHTTARPFRQVGFDTQFSSVTSVDTVADDVAGWLAEAGVTVDAEQRAAVTLLARASLPWNQPGEAEHAAARRVAEQLYELAQRQAPGAFVVRVLNDLLRNDDVQPPLNALVREFKAAKQPGASYEEWASEADADSRFQRFFGMRDQAMADNLLADLDRYPDARFVAWLANGHGIHDVNLIGDDDPRYRTLTTMGSLLHAALGEQAYCIATTSFDGTMNAGTRVPPKPLSPAAPDSVEAELHDRGFTTAFVDARRLPADSPWREPVTWRAWSDEQLPAPLAEITDGLLYLDRQQPSRPAGTS